VVATAHTRDDQIETIAFRAMRGAGARGLAGLYAASEVARPFVDLARGEIEAYAAAHRVVHTEDPSNVSLRHGRNRLRHEILPALRRVAPGLDEELLDIARRAARLRAETEAMATGFVRTESREAGALAADREALSTLDFGALETLWPAIASRVGVTLDRRGTERLASFTIMGRPGGRIQLSGHVEACRAGGEIRLGRRAAGWASPAGPARARLGGPSTLFGTWRFVRLGVDTEIGESPRCEGRNGHVAALPADASLEVRAWRPGDRMTLRREPGARRVKRYLAEAGLTVSEREGWPVVVADGEIVWIPGICRSDAATARSGRPVVHYACERFVR
jgi:tRNA(Ile)-lysidine synthase